MSSPEIVEHLSDGSSPALSYVIKPLPNRLEYIRLRGNVQQPLIGFRILNDSSSFSLHSENHRPFTLLDLLHEVAGPAPKGGTGLNIVRNVKHAMCTPPIEAPF